MANFNATYYTANSVYSAVQSPADSTYFSVGTSIITVAQSPADAIYMSPSSVTATSSVRYYQRVYSSGLGVWCYYSTVNALNSSPDSSATSPNWTGTISNAQVVATALIAQ